MSPVEGVQMPVGERSRLHLEAIVPIAAAQPLPAVSDDCQIAGLPLFEHVTVLVQHEPGIAEELLRGAAQIDAPPAGGGDGARMEPRVK